ncbi:hypothetical protein ABE504_21845 [Paenibacillus oryzisoli]|uniref:hypothetical protein n=1 Tax=Paenibacillus oryzisoli TaxID=1850517 RepID=UPI003D2E1284
MLNRKKIVGWIGLSVVLLLVATGCGKEKTDEEKLAEAFKNVMENAAQQSNAPAKQETVESKLSQINSFMTVNFWNEGFVNISWYTGEGTGSTGEKIDIDLIIDRLGKAMEKKAEYDTYMKGLDAKYDTIKPVWTKLSSETDKLYKQLKDNKPQAKDKKYAFDTGLFKQYSQAFGDDVNALNKK